MLYVLGHRKQGVNLGKAMILKLKGIRGLQQLGTCWTCSVLGGLCILYFPREWERNGAFWMYLQANPRNVPLQTTCHPNIYLLGYRSICEPDFKKHQYLYQYSGKTNKQTKKAPNTPKIKNSRPIPLNDPAEHTSDSVCLVSWQSFPVLPEISRFHPKSHMKAILLCNIPM